MLAQTLLSTSGQTSRVQSYSMIDIQHVYTEVPCLNAIKLSSTCQVNISVGVPQVYLSWTGPHAHCWNRCEMLTKRNTWWSSRLAWLKPWVLITFRLIPIFVLCLRTAINKATRYHLQQVIIIKNWCCLSKRGFPDIHMTQAPTTSLPQHWSRMPKKSPLRTQPHAYKIIHKQFLRPNCFTMANFSFGHN